MMLGTPPKVGSTGHWQTIGNPAAIALLEGAISQQRVSHAYLIVGPNRVGKRTLAVDFARAMNCNAADIAAPGWAELAPAVPCGECSACERIARSNFADVQIITSATQTSKDTDDKAARRRVLIGIDLIKDLQSDAMLKPYEGRVKVFIIDEANRMSPDAANALLKTLEEPPSQVHFILTSPAVEMVPETIASRCHVVRLKSVATDVIAGALVDRFELSGDEARALAKMSMGSPGWAIAALNDPSMLDARKQSGARILDVLNADLADRFDYASQMSRQFWSDRAVALEEVDRWLEIIRDIAMIKNELREHVVYDDRVEELDQIAKALSEDEIARAASAIQKTRDALMVNAIPQLAFDGMMLGLPIVA